MNRHGIFAFVVAALGVVLWTGAARAATSVYVLAIGYNGAPAAAGAGSNEGALQYADDDAAAFYQFARGFSRDAHLLTVMDADTQSRFPQEVTSAGAPTLAELRVRVQKLAELLKKDRERGDESVVLLFYSGHGSRPSGTPAALTLLDGSLTHETLYDEVLAAIPARYIHLFIDACYAEAIVRPRDAEAASVDLTEDDIANYAARATLARFPNVGAVVAASSSSQTHEWDGYRHGVFTHELLSGLRGAADVNLDGKIEYSELYAFLSAANRNVADVRARLSVVGRPPGANARAAIVDLTGLKSEARIIDIPERAGHVHFEDQSGNRLADIRVESGAKLALTIPSQKVVYIRCSLGEAEVTLRPDESLAFEHLALGPPTARVRGALELAMKRGLFAAGFGPNYYRGFIDQTTEFVPVPFVTEGEAAANAVASGPDVEPKANSWRTGRTLYFGGGATESIGHGLGAMAGVRLGLRPRDPTGLTISLDGAWGESAFAEWRALGAIGYRVGFRKSRFVAFGGLEVGGGVAGQKTPTASQGDGTTTASTGAVLGAPTLGASYQLANHFALGSEVSLTVLAFRRDDGVVTALALPAAYLGVAMDL